jgi:hypothetical protein
MDGRPASTASRQHARRPAWLAVLGVVVFIHLLILLVWSCRRPCQEVVDAEETPAVQPSATVTNTLPPIRELPAKFPPNTTLPNAREMDTCGTIRMSTFSPGRDLIRFDDPCVWWESDHDGETDDECDHTIHRKMEVPLQRVIAAVIARQGILKVQDTYRPTGIHNGRSLHREGRAIDLTCQGLELEELAKICWQAGFDWVYYERPRGGGDHIHASVRR